MLLALVNSAQAFTTTQGYGSGTLLRNKPKICKKQIAARKVCELVSPLTIRPQFTAIAQSKGEDVNTQGKDMNKIQGINSGNALFLIVLALTVWSFSIPTEFRRARFCSAEQVVNFPDSKCKTFGMWVGGVADYYRNGGGIKFDFSIENKE